MYSNEGGYKRGENNNIYIDDIKDNAKYKAVEVSFSAFYIFILIFVIIWFVAGILAFIASLVCMFFQGSVTDKTVGILLAIILGPFYWLYYIYNINYCTR